MEKPEHLTSANISSCDEVAPFSKYVKTKVVPEFGFVDYDFSPTNQRMSISVTPNLKSSRSLTPPAELDDEEMYEVPFKDLATSVQEPKHFSQADESCESHSFSIIVPSCPTDWQMNETRRDIQQPHCSNEYVRDTRYDSFKTWSGRLERQLSNLRGRHFEPELDLGHPRTTDVEALPVDRYFDALEGPELDVLKASEILVLPEDKKWPFLLRFPISSFGICLGVSSQAILWKTLATYTSTRFLHISPYVNFALWCVALALMATVSSIYLLKVIFYFEAVRREYYHPIRVNFFFAPWIACLFLALGVPHHVAATLPSPLWYVLMAPILCLELKIYGEWMLGGQRRLSKVANPSNHLSIVGNFVGALLGASMGLKEGPIFFFAIGLAHYTVLFVTLYQRLPTSETLPKELHPVFFLFVAAPSVACTAWAKIRGDFDYGSRVAYFIAIFLYGSLAVRINFFTGFRFSLAWWAYTFPMAGASIATLRYSMEVKNPLTQTLSVVLSAISTFTVTALLFSTIFHAFVLRDLFPNDISIAISERRCKPGKKHNCLRPSGCIVKDYKVSIPIDHLKKKPESY